MMTPQQVGRKNIRVMYTFTAASRLWFDGGLWVIYFQHRGISLFQIGLLEALLHITALLSDVPVGMFADRFGWKLSLGLGSLMGLFYTTCALWGTNIWWFALAFVARGLQVTMTSGSDSSILYESAVWAGLKDQYLKFSGRIFAIMLVSLGLAEAAGGVFAQVSWTYVYVAFTLANLVSFVIVLFIREPRAARIPGDPGEHPTLVSIARDAWRFARSCPPYVAWLGMSAILSGFVAVFGFYGQSMLRDNGWTLIGIGVLMGAENGCGALVAVLAHRFVRKAGERFTVTLANVIATIGMVLFAYLPGLSSGVGYLLDSMATNLADPVVDQALNRLVPSEQRATLLSAHSTSFSVFMMVVFPIFGAFAGRFGLVHTAWGFAVAATVSIGLCLWWWTRTTSRGSRAPSNLLL